MHPILTFGVILLVLLMPIVAWQAYVRGRSPWIWGIVTPFLLGLPAVGILMIEKTAHAPSAATQIHSFWPRLGWASLFMLVATTVLIGSVSAMAWAGGMTVQQALQVPPWLSGRG